MPSKKIVKVAEREPILPRLIQAVVAVYHGDPSTPSVVLSQIPSDKCGPLVYYVSIVRYREPYGEGKYVVVSGRNADLGECIRDVGRRWMKKEGID